MNSKRKTTKPTLTDDEWRKVFDLVEKAGKLPEGEQIAFIRRATESRPDLQHEALCFLEGEPGASSFLESPIGPEAAFAILNEDLKEGEEISDFLIKKEIGRGAFATVYLAQQKSLDREVALKVTRFHQGDEARTIAKMEHEHIITVYSVTNLDSPPVQLIGMQYVSSLDLEHILSHLPETSDSASALLDVVDEHAITEPKLDIRGMELRAEISQMSFCQGVARIGVQLADALEYAHQKGVLHLDIKPANILLNHFGHAYLTDFNISSAEEALKNSIPKNFGGTAYFMSPEQQEVFTSDDKQEALREIDRRSDVFSLGRVLATLLERGGDCPHREAIRRVIDKACCLGRHDRYATAKDFAQALSNSLETSEIVSRLPQTRGLERWLEKNPVLAYVGVGALPQIVATVVAIFYNSTQIVSALNPLQQETFNSLNAIYNPLISLFALGIWLTQVWKLHGFLSSRDGAVDASRRHLLSMPKWGILVSTLGWVPGAVIFPLTIITRGGPLPLETIVHLKMSFTFSYLIALCYTFFLHQWITLLQYRYFWSGSESRPAKAAEELAPLPRRMLGFCLGTGLIPLLGASIVLFQGPMGLSSSDDSFRWLVAALIGLGVVGVFFAMTLYQRLSRLVYLWGYRGN